MLRYPVLQVTKKDDSNAEATPVKTKVLQQPRGNVNQGSAYKGEQLGSATKLVLFTQTCFEPSKC